MATSNTWLLKQKQIQWTTERDKMSKLTKDYAAYENCSNVHTSIRAFSNSMRCPLTNVSVKHQYRRYTKTKSVKNLVCNASGICTTKPGNLQDQLEVEQVQQCRSPSLPPIYKHEHHFQIDEHQQRQSGLTYGIVEKLPKDRCCRGSEDREGETSGYASDNIDGPAQKESLMLPCHVNCNSAGMHMDKKIWLNPYYSDNSLSSSKRLASLRTGEFNRQRWGGCWSQELSKDLPPPSWLERGLSRLDHNSQVLVINHESASSPDSSTCGSFRCDVNKIYLRDKNLPIDVNILQKREAKKQKALELQTAINQQLDEREKKIKKEREKRTKEEQAEKEQIKRESDLKCHRSGFEVEHRKQDLKAAKLKKSRKIREVLDTTKHQLKEEIRQSRVFETSSSNSKNIDSNPEKTTQSGNKDVKETLNRRKLNTLSDSHDNTVERDEAILLPVSQDLIIVLSGLINDPKVLTKSPLRLMNLFVSSSFRGKIEKESNSSFSLGIFLNGLDKPVILQKTRMSPLFMNSRLLTPSKYRMPSNRNCGTQTDYERENTTDFMEKGQENVYSKEAKEHSFTNNNYKDVEKSTTIGSTNESSIKTLGRNKSQVHTSLESRPQWNANRPGTRYRTQSEKDPHYQRRLKIRRKQIETSDDGSSDFRQSPISNRCKYNITKTKLRNSVKHKTKLDNYEANLAMDNLNSLIPLNTDKNGRINIKKREKTLIRGQNAERDVWCRENILSHLNSLKNGLIIKKREWDLEDHPISPITELY